MPAAKKRFGKKLTDLAKHQLLFRYTKLKTMNLPFCPKCNKTSEKMILTPHAVWFENDETQKLEICQPQYMFIQCEKCGYCFGTVDSELHQKVDKLMKQPPDLLAN